MHVSLNLIKQVKLSKIVTKKKTHTIAKKRIIITIIVSSQRGNEKILSIFTINASPLRIVSNLTLVIKDAKIRHIYIYVQHTYLWKYKERIKISF